MTNIIECLTSHVFQLITYTLLSFVDILYNFLSVDSTIYLREKLLKTLFSACNLFNLLFYLSNTSVCTISAEDDVAAVAIVVPFFLHQSVLCWCYRAVSLTQMLYCESVIVILSLVVQESRKTAVAFWSPGILRWQPKTWAVVKMLNALVDWFEPAIFVPICFHIPLMLTTKPRPPRLYENYIFRKVSGSLTWKRLGFWSRNFVHRRLMSWTFLGKKNFWKKMVRSV